MFHPPGMNGCLNSSLHKSIGDTPHYIVFGQDHKLPYSFLLKEEEPIYNFDDYVRVRGTDLQKMYKRVSHNIVDSKSTMNESQWSTASQKIIVIGDLVYQKVQEPKNKLAPRFEGPYRVIDYDKGNKVKLRHLTTLETKLAHLDHLKRVTCPDSTVVDRDQDTASAPPDVPPTDNKENTESMEYRKKLRSYKGDEWLTKRGFATYTFSQTAIIYYSFSIYQFLPSFFAFLLSVSTQNFLFLLYMFLKLFYIINRNGGS